MLACRSGELSARAGMGLGEAQTWAVTQALCVEKDLGVAVKVSSSAF